MSHSSRPLGKGKRGRGYPQPAEAPLGKGQGSKRASNSLEKDTTPTKEGWWRDPSNAEKEGAYMGPVNNKEKPSGTGTIGKQWDALEKAGAAYRPDSEESMDTHIDQLHKALEKPDWRRPTGGFQAPIFEGQKKFVQEKNAQEARVLRIRRQRSLSRGKTGPRVDVEASKKALEKAREDLEAKKAAELGKAEADEGLQAKSKPKSKARPKFKEERSSSLGEEGQGPGERIRQAKKGHKVCVDWRNTLEKGGIVPESHIQHLELLMQHCSVFICSYVKSKWREQEVTRLSLSLVFLI